MIVKQRGMYLDKFEVRITTEQDIFEICNWRYEEPYDVYNYPEFEILREQEWGILFKETREREFLSLYKNRELIGNFRFIENEKNVILGLSLKPDFCGQGFGSKFMRIILKEYNNRFEDKNLILKVREFNKRAIKLYKNSGFIIIGSEIRNINGENIKMLIMQYKAN